MTKMKINSKLKMFFCSFLFGLNIIGYGQHLDEELKLKLSEMERKKIAKSDDEYQSGRKAEDAANNFLINDSAKSAYEKAENKKKFTSKRLNASVYYGKANNIKIEVYHSAIKHFWKNFKGDKLKLFFTNSVENMANDSLAKATDLRFNANKSQNLPDKLDLTIQAENIEHRFIGVLGKVLYSYLSYPEQFDSKWLLSFNSDLPEEVSHVISDTTKINKIDSTNQKYTVQPDNLKSKNDTLQNSKVYAEKVNKFQSNDSSLYGKMSVGEDQIDTFNNFLKKQYPAKYKDYVINFQELDYSDINSLRDAWYKYLYGSPVNDSLNVATVQKKQQEPYIAAQNNPVNTTKTTTKTNGNNIAKHNKTVIAREKLAKTMVAENNLPDTSSGFVFKVQIAACRVQLDEKTLKGIYAGSEKITELYEDKWYKYVISQSPAYGMARKIRDNLKIPGAFVIAYLNGTRIKITPAIAFKHKKINKTPSASAHQGTFRLQLAASRIRMNEKFLKNIYNGNIAIDTIFEDNWFKYSIICGNNYSDALKLMRQLTIPGAFIVEYENNRKVKIEENVNY